MATSTTPRASGRGRRVQIGALVLGTVIFLAGIGIAAAGFAYDVVFVNLPYQDPPPDLQQRWERDAAFAGAIERFGVYTAAAGVGILAALFAAISIGRLRGRRDVTESRVTM